MSTLAFLGPEGTFAHAALLGLETRKQGVKKYK